MKGLSTFNQTLTIYRKGYTLDENNRKRVSYRRQTAEDSFFSVTRVQALEGTSLNAVDSYIARMPLSADVKKGDVIVKGLIYDEVTDTEGHRLSDLLEAHKGESFTVQTVKVNDSIPFMQHIRAEGV